VGLLGDAQQVAAAAQTLNPPSYLADGQA